MENDDTYWRHTMGTEGTQPNTGGPSAGNLGAASWGTAPMGEVPVAKSEEVPTGEAAPAAADAAAQGQPIGGCQPAAEPQQPPAAEFAQQQPAAEPQPVAEPQQPAPEPQQPAPELQQQSAPAAGPQYAQSASASREPMPPAGYSASVAGQPVYGTASAPAPKSHWWIVAIVIVAALAGTILYSVSACTTMFGSFSGGQSSTSSLSDLTTDTVGIIEISGTIQYDGTACSPEGLKELLDIAEKNEHIKAVILRVDSGGGTATAGEEMAEYVKQFSKPIVVSSASINASAAYEISSQADYIFVAKSTEIGAIGTAMELADLSGLLDKLGVNMETITSSDSKDSSYGYRELTDEERAYYQEMVDQINDVFVQNVADGRKMSLEDVRALATGMPFTGLAAIDNGLADAVGTREDAVDKAAELAGITGSVDPVSIDFDYYYNFDSLYTLLGSSNSSAEELLAVLDAAGSGAHMK